MIDKKGNHSPLPKKLTFEENIKDAKKIILDWDKHEKDQYCQSLKRLQTDFIWISLMVFLCVYLDIFSQKYEYILYWTPGFLGWFIKFIYDLTCFKKLLKRHKNKLDDKYRSVFKTMDTIEKVRQEQEEALKRFL